MTINLENLKVVPKNLTNERRDSKRIRFYRGEFPNASVEIGSNSYEVEIYDLSSKGVGLLPKQEIPGLDDLSQVVTLKFHNSTTRPAALCNISHIRYSGAYRLKLGFELGTATDTTTENENRFWCEGSMPLAYCDDPIAFSRTLLFNILYFSPNGVGLTTSEDNIALIEGMLLELKVMMPVRGEFRALAQIESITQKGKSIEIQCRWNNISNDFDVSIAEFLLMTCPGLTISELKKHSFSVARLEKAFVFRCVQTEEQMTEVLKLRLKAAQKDGRWLNETDHNVMRDDWDDRARQLYCEINGKVVAASRVVFNNGIYERSEHHNYGVKLPDWLIDKGFVEGSRMCTDPEFRGSELFVYMIQQTSKIVSQSGYRYFVLNCVDNLVPVYKKLAGVNLLKRRFKTEYMKESYLNLLYVDVRKIQLGIKMSPFTWIVHAPVGDYLEAQGRLKLKLWERIYRGILSPLHFLAGFIFRRKRLKAK